MSKFRGFLMTVVMLLVAVGLMGCYGTPKVPKYKLTITYVGNGTVTEAGMSFNEGTTVTLHPVPGTNSVFAGWSGPSSGEVIGNKILMNSDKTLVANFDSGPAIKSYDTWGSAGQPCTVKLYFDGPRDSSITRVKVYREDTITRISWVMPLSKLDPQEFTDPDSGNFLTYEHEYNYWVVPLDAGGNELVPGPKCPVKVGVKQVVSVPAPTNVVVSTGAGNDKYQVNVSWDPVTAGTGQIKYRVSYTADQGASYTTMPLQSTTSSTISFDTPGANLRVRVQAVLETVDTANNPITINSPWTSEHPVQVGGAVPKAPSLNGYTVPSTRTLRIAWGAVNDDAANNAVNVTYYRVYQKLGTGTPIYTQFGSSVLTADLPLATPGDYVFWVTAVSDKGIESLPSPKTPVITIK